MSYQDYMEVQGDEDLRNLFKEDGSINHLWLTKISRNDRVFLLKTILTKEEWKSEIFCNCISAMAIEDNISVIIRGLSNYWGVSKAYIERKISEAKKMLRV